MRRRARFCKSCPPSSRARVGDPSRAIDFSSILRRRAFAFNRTSRVSIARRVRTARRAALERVMDDLPHRPYGVVDETAFALEGMWMPNPGEYPPTKHPFDDVNTVRSRAHA